MTLRPGTVRMHHDGRVQTPDGLVHRRERSIKGIDVYYTVCNIPYYLQKHAARLGSVKGVKVYGEIVTCLRCALW